jgi:hypothetical protein
LLARPAPSIWTGGIGIVTPEEADALASIDCKGDVFADQPNAFAAMNRTVGLRLSHRDESRGVRDDDL